MTDDPIDMIYELSERFVESTGKDPWLIRASTGFKRMLQSAPDLYLFENHEPICGKNEMVFDQFLLRFDLRTKTPLLLVSLDEQP